MKHSSVRKLRVGLPLLTSVLLSTGCYRHTPVSLELVPEAQNVRVLVTPRGAVQLAEIGAVRGEIPSVSGHLIGKDDSELSLRVPVGQRREGFHFVSLDQTIRIPTDEVLQVELRQFDRGRTALLTAGALAVATLVVVSIMEAVGGDSSNPFDPFPPLEMRIPTHLHGVPPGR